MAKPGEIIIELRAKELGLELEKLSIELERELNDAVESVANAAYAKIIAKAQNELSETRATYLKDLRFDQIGTNSYLITLEGDFSTKIEDGFGSYSIKDQLLGSNKKVSVGSRSGKPWVQQSTKGTKFAHVPFEKKPFSKAPKGNDMSAIIRQLTIKNTQGRKQRLTSVFKTPAGTPLEGKVAVVTGTSVKDLEGLIKYQHVRETKSGKQKVESFYVNYRTVSDKPGTADWKHPGWRGLKSFQEVEEWTKEQIDNILKDFLA